MNGRACSRVALGRSSTFPLPGISLLRVHTALLLAANLAAGSSHVRHKLEEPPFSGRAETPNLQTNLGTFLPGFTFQYMYQKPPNSVLRLYFQMLLFKKKCHKSSASTVSQFSVFLSMFAASHFLVQFISTCVLDRLQGYLKSRKR